MFDFIATKISSQGDLDKAIQEGRNNFNIVGAGIYEINNPAASSVKISSYALPAKDVDVIARGKVGIEAYGEMSLYAYGSVTGKAGGNVAVYVLGPNVDIKRQNNAFVQNLLAAKLLTPPVPKPQPIVPTIRQVLYAGHKPNSLA